MPALDGIAVCRRLRRDGDRTPILMLTARDAVSDRVAGLDAGADDYLVKPFALEELLARVRALLRRTVNGDPHGVLRFADVSLDPATREVRRGDAGGRADADRVPPARAVPPQPAAGAPRAVIFERVWGYDFGPRSNSLEVYVGYLRRKLEAGGENRAPADRARSRLRAGARAMSFRARITLAAAAAVAVAVAVLSVAAYVVAGTCCTGRSTTRSTNARRRRRCAHAGRVRDPASGASARCGRARAPDRQRRDDRLWPRSRVLPVDQRSRGRSGTPRGGFGTAELEGVPVRVYVQRLAPGYAVLVARPLTEVESTLGRLRTILVAIAMWDRRRRAPRAARRPLGAATGAAADDDRRGDSAHRRPHPSDRGHRGRRARPARVDPQHHARVARALGGRAAQPRRRRVTRAADAVDEHPDERRAARPRRRRQADGAEADGRGRRRAARGADGARRRPGRARRGRRARRRDRGRAARRGRRRIRRACPAARPGALLRVRLEPTLVRGSPARLDRAIVNLLENAVAWGPADEPIEVTVADGAVVVRDHGPGIADEDAERLFDRFYRSARARGRPGSGLGLAIVRQVAETHGGRPRPSAPKAAARGSGSPAGRGALSEFLGAAQAPLTRPRFPGS